MGKHTHAYPYKTDIYINLNGCAATEDLTCCSNTDTHPQTYLWFLYLYTFISVCVYVCMEIQVEKHMQTINSDKKNVQTQINI